MIPNIAIIGVGGFASCYINSLTPLINAKQANLIAAVVRNPEKHREIIERLSALGCKVFKNTTAMYKELVGKIDVVAIPTSIDTHAMYTLEALKNNCNVMVEKPAAGTIEEVELMIQAEKNTPNKWVMVGFQHLCSPEIQELKKRLVNNEFGRLQSITTMGRWPRADVYYNRNDWAAKVKNANGAIVNDSPANNAFAHYLNIALFLSGTTFEVPAYPKSVSSKLFRSRPIETFDTCDISIDCDNSVQVRALFTHACDTNFSPSVKIRCENATIVWQSTPTAEGFFEVFGANGKLIEKSNMHNCFYHEFNCLIQKCHNPNIFVGTLSEALAHTKTIELIHQNMQVTDIPTSELTIQQNNGQRIISWVNQYFDQVFNMA